MPARHSHPVIHELCQKLDVLDPSFIAFANSHSYDFTKTEDGNFNPPHRRLRRTIHQFEISQCLSLQIVGRDTITYAPPLFGPDMPCTLWATATVLVNEDWTSIQEEIFSALPFNRVQSDLLSYLIAAQQKLDEWNCEKLKREGIRASDTLRR